MPKTRTTFGKENIAGDGGFGVEKRGLRGGLTMFFRSGLFAFLLQKALIFPLSSVVFVVEQRRLRRADSNFLQRMTPPLSSVLT